MLRAGSPLTLLAALVFAGCANMPAFQPSDAETVLARRALEGSDPTLPGQLGVLSLYYGSGTDQRRSEYRDSVSIETEAVDASALVDLGSSAKSRNKYWGFSPEEFPINGRVWYPDGPGPYPLVLVVHGNHNPRDFSDPGYDYLGEFLASRGFILASVDMNFINGGIRQENDARGWLLLKHLQAWKSFNQAEEGPLRGLVDMDRISLMGHSRGGEAVGHAAAFNQLSRYPDDASVTFEFGFNVRSIVAIAPVDGQYMPTGRHVPVSGVSYLVFHGSHDGDVTSFHGLRQYQRVTLDPDSDQFKAAVYVYRANHGQWNTVWNNKDRGPRSGRSLRLDTLIEPEEQRKFAKLYLLAFLEATLNGEDRYLSLFRDHRVAGDWLPGTMYVTRYQHSSFRPLATFEEDIDVTTGTGKGVRIRGDSLKTWKEDAMTLRSRNRTSTSASQQNQAAWIGWEQDSTDAFPQLVLDLGDEDWDLSPSTTLELLLSPGGNTEEDSLSRPGAILDLTVEVTDRNGISGHVALSGYGPIRKPLDIRILRRNGDDDRFGETWEAVLQGFSLPLADFQRAQPGLDITALASVALVFDRSEKGTVIVDDIGFAAPSEGFRRYRLSER